MISLDLQLNGFAGVDFNVDDLSLADLRRGCAAFQAQGGHRFLATIITDRLDLMVARIARLAAHHAADAAVRDAVAGIHVEGPCISPLPGFVGAHPPAHVIPATVATARQLVEAGRGLVRLVTLAPECDAGLATTAWLAGQGILVSAGHCDASAERLEEAVAAGLAAFTHLGNGCPLTLHRHDNVIQRVLAADRLRWVMLIPDAVHVPPSMVRTIIRTVGIDRVIAVTDATAAGGMGAGRFTLAGREVVVEADGAAWAADRSHLVGSTASMSRVREVLRNLVGLSEDDVSTVVSTNPAAALAAAAGRR